MIDFIVTFLVILKFQLCDKIIIFAKSITMEKYLLLYTYVDGFFDTPFPSVENQVAVYDFSYDAKRMGGAPVISSTFMYDKCLDKEWSYKVYAMFNGERYFLKQIPSSSYDNTDSRYKHEMELVSERIVLDNVYVYDVVSSDVSYDKPVSNSSIFTFFGDISEFAKRLNYSLGYSHIGYSVVVDAGITSEAKMVTFGNSVFSNAIQEAYNTFNIPYYFVGKTIHIGYTNNDIAHIFRYGVDESLLSINKQNANQKIITRITGSGSSDNIPYYYPNDFESKDEVEASGGKWIIPQEKLMPPVYRQTSGAERFYNAINGQYEGYTFENEYVSGNQREHIIDFEDIKPSIAGMTNASGQRIDMFSAFSYDTNDNDDFDDDGNYIHPYFFAKLRKMDGDNGFNLFDHAIDENEMTISMTSGSCGACEWTIMVDENTKKNTVQVDGNGNLVRDNDGNVKFGTAQDKQNDTRNNEVWIALKKDIDTFGVIMPNADHNYKPSINDTFVIIHINLPKAYILAAEERLKDKLIEYMANNNSEKFNFSIAFSRIFFAENIDILNQLNENARLQVEYDKEVYTLYVSSYSYNMSSDCPLPEIKVELSDTLTISRNALQEAMDSVKADMISMMDTIGKNTAYPNVFIRKDRDDYTSHLVSFLAGLKAFNYVQGMIGGSGAAIFKDEAKKTVIEIDKIHAREELVVPKITFNCIDAISGDQAATFAYGTIKEVDRENMIATLDLLEDQIGTLDVNDICRGVYHNLEGGNSAEEAVDDDNGFYKYAGFSTSYFTPVEIITNKPGEFVFRYELQPNTSVHPMKGMNFFAYGNFIDQSRQSITYQTRTYRRLLHKVSTWIIEPDRNIAGQWGKLDGLTIGEKVMEGIGSFQQNCYFTGAYIQFTPEQKDELQGLDSYSVVLSNYDAVCHLDPDGNIVSPIYTYNNVVNEAENVVTGNENVVTSGYYFSTLIQAFRGETPLFYSETYQKGAYMVSVEAHGCSYIIENGRVSITEITNTTEAYLVLNVNCEGNVVFEKRFTITFVVDAKSPITADLDNEVDSVLCDNDGNVVIGLPISTTISMWYGTEQLSLDNIVLSIPSGVTASYTLSTGKISVTAISKEASKVLQLGISASATYLGRQYTKTALFTINKVSQGEKGENAVLYRVIPSASSIKKSSDGTYSPSTISCSVTKLDGETASSVSELPDGYSMTYTVDEGTEKSYYIGAIFSVTSYSSGIAFKLYKDSVLVDKESVPVISDGKDGTDGADGTNGTDGKDGNDSTVYIVTPSSTSVTYTSTGSLNPSSITFTCRKAVGSSYSTETAYWKVYVSTGSGEPTSLLYSQSSYSTTYTLSISSSYTSYKIVAYPYNFSDNRMAEARVNIVSDGQNGSPGSMGATLRPMGLYNSSTTYVYNSEFRDCVYDISGNVWMVKSYGDSITGSTPSSSNSRWLQGNKAIFTAIDTALIDNANIAGFLYSNQKMMSADKTSLILDGINGSITANKGTIGGFALSSSSLTTTTEGQGSIKMNISGTKFIRINVSGEDALFSARNDSGLIMKLNAYGENATALDVLCNSSGVGYALKSHGRVCLMARSSKEMVTIAGLSLSYGTGTSFTESFVNNIQGIDITSGWKDFLVTSADVTLPSASSYPGKVLFLKRTANSKLSSSSPIVYSDSNQTTTSTKDGPTTAFYISNGTNWYEFTCRLR